MCTEKGDHPALILEAVIVLNLEEKGDERMGREMGISGDQL